jgi:myosin-1
MQCTPHYIRCIKPNETKKPHDWETDRVRHQVEYLGLKENIRVRRAGFAYRRPFEKFLRRYAVLTSETFPQWHGTVTDGIKHLMNSVNMEPDQWQLGRTKVFVKNPESLFLLEEVRERKYDSYARVLQKAWRRFHSDLYFYNLKKKASSLVLNKKDRRRGTINRNFFGDYLGLEHNPSVRALLGKREKADFAFTVNKYDRRFKCAKRDIIVTQQFVYLIGREKIAKGPQKGQIMDVVKRKLAMEDISGVSLSPYQDDFVVLHTGAYDTVMELVFKTEFLNVLSAKYQHQIGKSLPIKFNAQVLFQVKKEGFGGGGKKTISFQKAGVSEFPSLKTGGGKLIVSIGEGLPSSTTPGRQTPRRGSGYAQQHANRRPVAGGGRPRPQVGGGRFNRQQSGSLKRRNTMEKAPHMPQGGQKQLANSKLQQFNPSFLQVAQPGAGTGHGRRKVPDPPKSRPPPPAPPSLPKCKAIYPYDAQDTDELTFGIGDIIDIVKRGKH